MQLLQRQATNIGVSVLCPLFVDTKIMEAERNRPRELYNGESPEPENPLRMRDSTPASEEADRVFEAVRDGKFYIFPFMQAVDDNVRARFDAILARENPEPRPMR